MSPIYDEFGAFKDTIPLLQLNDSTLIEIQDTVENIFNRLIFTDENDVMYDDCEEYRNKHKKHNLKSIREDVDYFKRVYQCITNKINIAGLNIEDSADLIIEKFKLKPKTTWNEWINVIKPRIISELLAEFRKEHCLKVTE